MIVKGFSRYIIIVALISIGMSLLVHFNSILDIIDAGSRSFRGNSRIESFNHVAGEVFVTFLVAFCTFLINYYIINPLDGLKKVGIRRVIISIVATLASVYVLSDLFFAVKSLLNAAVNQNKFVLLYFFRDSFMATVVLICIYIIKGFYEKQAVLIENEKLSRENLQSQYQSLKNQVSPHFLFNSLTALKELIDDDPAIAGDYVKHLSQVLRYTLRSNENQTISLFDEIESVKSYLFLIKMRFGSNLQVDFRINEVYNSHRLPPMVIQTLIENAVKHNEISRRNPLNILLMTSESNSLIVTNTLQKKVSLEPGTGIGLNNLLKQYLLLCGEEVRISSSENEFRVEVPLIKPTGDENNNC
jgi:sensor histidine kinase YesM